MYPENYNTCAKLWKYLSWNNTNFIQHKLWSNKKIVLNDLLLLNLLNSTSTKNKLIESWFEKPFKSNISIFYSNILVLTQLYFYFLSSIRIHIVQTKIISCAKHSISMSVFCFVFSLTPFTSRHAMIIFAVAYCYSACFFFAFVIAFGFTLAVRWAIECFVYSLLCAMRDSFVCICA